MMLSESASAQISLTSTTGTAGSPVFHYDIKLTDTGTTNIGTFWFGWVPGEDFLPSLPSAVSNPTGWGNALTGSHNSSDGTAIQWVASSNAITPGNSLSGFDFTSTDSPTVLAGMSPSHPGEPTTTAFVYSGGPFSDGGFQLVATPPVTAAASTTSLVSSAPSANSGAALTLTATVASASGSGPVPTGSVSFTEDGNALGTANLGSDGTAILVVSTLPVGTDPVTATYGGDSNYGGSASAPLSQVITPPANAIAQSATLGATIAKSTLPTSVVADQAVNGSVTVDLANLTSATVKGKSTIQIFAATGGGIDGSSIMLGQVAHATPVMGSRSVSVVVPVRIRAGQLPAAAYTLFARVMDPTGNSSDSAAGPALSAAAPLISLAQTLVHSGLPASVASGATAHGIVTLNVTNNGNITTPGITTITLQATTGGVLDSSAIQLASASVPLRIRPGKSAHVSIALKRLPQAALGTYTVLAEVVDGNGGISSVLVGTIIVTAAAATPGVGVSSPAPGGGMTGVGY